METRTTKRISWLLVWSTVASALLTGCQPMQPFYLNPDGDCDLSHYVDTQLEIEYTDVNQEPLKEVTESMAPRTVSNPQLDNVDMWDITLEEALSTALNNSKVIRTFGQVRQFGQIVGSAPNQLTAAPDSVATIYDVAIQETGQNGVEQALSTFDAIFTSSATWDNTDRPQNFQQLNTVNSTIFQQDRVTIDNEITKRSATGTQWSLRNQSIYTGANNTLTAGTRGVPSDWFTAFEFEARQPWLQNRGAQVNRIPIVLARIRTDLSLIDFQGAVMELTNQVESGYWELYFFYNNLKAAKIGRDSALAAWKKVNALYEKGTDGGEAENVARAKEQYFFFRDRVEQAQDDLFKSETRLRYLMGLAATDHRFLRPSDKPTTARVTYEWNNVVTEGLCRNAAIRRQGWRIRRTEMQLIAARNQVLPRLDTVALYRWLGVGDEFNSFFRDEPEFPAAGSTAVDSLWDLDNQEFTLGFEFEIPLGQRQALNQIRSSELGLARERAKLQDMELTVVHQLTDAIQELDSGYRSLSTNYSRRVSAEQQVAAVERAFQAGTSSLDLLLQAQRSQAEATIAYHTALVSYNRAILTMQMRKGSLLAYNGIMLAEGPWPAKAYFDAANRARRRDASHYLDYGYSRPRVISGGKVGERCPPAVEPATYTEDPYESADFGAASASSDSEPTPADESDRPTEDSLDDAIDSMEDGTSNDPPKKPANPKKRRDSGLPDIPEPDPIDPADSNTPDTAPPTSDPRPEIDLKEFSDPDLDDLEASTPRRTANRSNTPAVEISWGN